MEQKTFIEAIVPITNALEKYIFAARRFVSCFFSGRIKTLAVYFCLYESSLYFSGIEDQINTVYEK